MASTPDRATLPARLRFTKMHGAGNDYVFLDVFESPAPEDPAALARAISDRRRGVGADGLILIAPSEVADARMIVFNADGSPAPICGNGIRCVAKLLFDRGRLDGDRARIETGAGVREARLLVEGGRATGATIDMGKPIFGRAAIPVAGEGVDAFGLELGVEGRAFSADALSMGNPHAVVLLEEPLEDFALERFGPAIASHPLFPEGANVAFVVPLGPGAIAQRTWERGSGETEACGSAACAAAVVAVRRGLASREVLVRLRGGDLRVAWDGTGSVFLTGPAVEVFEGEWALRDASAVGGTDE